MAYCKICGKPTSCTNPIHWKNIACCIPHYQTYMLQENGGDIPLAYKLRVLHNDAMYDVKDYIIGENDVELLTTASDKSIMLSDTEYLIVLPGEKTKILTKYDFNGSYAKITKDQYAEYIKYSVPLGPAVTTPVVDNIESEKDEHRDEPVVIHSFRNRNRDRNK